MLRCSERVENTGGVDPYSTGDYCETPDSTSMRHGEEHQYTSVKHHCRSPSVTRCLKKHYRCSPQRFYHQPRMPMSISNRCRRSIGKKLRRNHHVEETTSMDERRSITSYSSLLTVDVTREMEAVNRDIEEIIRRCDDLHVDNAPPTCRACCHHRKSAKMEQKRMVSKKPPLDKLKDIPIGLLKPRPPRYSLKEKSYSAPQAKYKTSRDIRDIVEETDALLRNVYKELSRSKCHRVAEEEMCQCEVHRGVSDPRPATCLERFLGCQNKCRRIHENRWMRPKWREVLEKGEMIRMLHPGDDRMRHHHDTNCVSEPTSSCLMRLRKEYQEPYRTVMKLKDTAVNTDPHEMELKIEQKSEPKENKPISPLPFENIQEMDTDKSFCKKDEKKYDIDLQPLKAFVNYNVETSSKNFIVNCDKRFSGKKSYIEDGKQRICKKDEWNENKSLLLDRNMGLSFERGEDKVKLMEEKNPFDDSLCPERPVIPLPENFTSPYEEDAISKKSGAGDTLSALETSKSFISQIINKIVNRRVDLPPINFKVLNQEKQEFENGMIDSSICLEIMRRLVDLMSRNDQHRFESVIGELPVQYGRVRKMKQEHLGNIEKELKYIQDLEFYLVNASPRRS